jgi:hypothetical protein
VPHTISRDLFLLDLESQIDLPSMCVSSVLCCVVPITILSTYYPRDDCALIRSVNRPLSGETVIRASLAGNKTVDRRGKKLGSLALTITSTLQKGQQR